MAARRPLWRQIIAKANDERGEYQRPDSAPDQAARAPRRSSPLLEGETPDGREDNDAGHMQGPAGKAEGPHLALAHRVEKELEVPDRPAERG